MKRVVGILLLAIILVACGGGGQEAAVPTAPPQAEESAETAPDTSVEEPAASAPAETEAEPEPDVDEEPEGEEPAGEASTAEAAPSDAEGDLVYTGADPETGLPVNPEAFAQGEEFIVRGELISYNLTPATTPEFLVKAPSGQNYRIAAQAVGEIFFADGVTQLAPHLYRRGIQVQATAMMPLGSTASDVLQSTDFMILSADQ